MAGLVKAPTSLVDPHGLIRRPGPRNYITPKCGTWVPDARRGPPRPRTVRSARPPSGGQRCGSRSRKHWGFYCDYSTVVRARRRSAPPLRPARSEAKPRIPDHHVAGRQGAELGPQADHRADQGHQPQRAAAGRDRARLGPGAHAGREPQVQAGQPHRPAEQDLVRPAQGGRGHPRHLPEHDQPDHHRRRGHHRLPGGPVFKISTW